MTKLHELLAVEKTRTAASNKLLQETMQKFGKAEMFSGYEKTLKMIEDSPQNAALEAAAAESRELPTTVAETLVYALQSYAQAEDVLFQKNCTNMNAVADIEFRGSTLVPNVPVDELLGLESRLESIRRVLEAMPTLAASTVWVRDPMSGRDGAWVAEAVDKTIKTEKTTVPVVLYEATDKHPAQVKEVSTDKTVGTFSVRRSSGAATSAQKAEALTILDELLVSVKQARMRANSVEIVDRKIGQTIVDLILTPFETRKRFDALRDALNTV